MFKGSIKRWVQGAAPASDQNPHQSILGEPLDTAALLQAIDSLHDGFLLTDAQDRVLLWNDKYIEYLPYLRPLIKPGVSARELVKAGAKAVLPNASDQEREQWVQWRMQIRMAGQGQVEFTFQNGQSVVFTDRRTPAGGVVCLLRDVTEIKQAERELLLAREAAEEANQAKTRFVTHVSHEIRTAMNGILGMAQIMSKTEVPAPQNREYAKVIWRTGQSLLEMLNDLLDLSRMEAGKTQINQSHFHPQELLDEMSALHGPTAREKQLSLQAHWLGRADDTYLTDANKLRQMLDNLVSNALKFTPTGQVRIEGRLIEGQGPAWLEFSVSDTGPGLTQEQMGRLFQPFSQVGGGSAQQGSSGLGLSIVKQLAQLLGGDCGVSSQMGRGSRFWFRVPAVELELRTTDPTVPMSRFLSTDFNPTVPIEEVSAGAEGGLRVLVVDDEVVNRQVLQLMLRKMGCVVQEAANGQEALFAMQAEKRPELVFMDCMMPVMDGNQATREIRFWEQEQAASRLPVVALTAKAYETDRQECLQAGMDDFLTKPVELKAIQAIIERFRRKPGAVKISHEQPPQRTAVEQKLPIFDAEGLLERLEGDAGIAAKVVALYLNDMQSYVDGIVQAAADFTATELTRKAHVLAGASGNVSAMELNRLAKQLENWSDKGAWADVLGSMETLKTLSTQTRRELEHFVALHA